MPSQLASLPIPVDNYLYAMHWIHMSEAEPSYSDYHRRLTLLRNQITKTRTARVDAPVERVHFLALLAILHPCQVQMWALEAGVGWCPAHAGVAVIRPEQVQLLVMDDSVTDSQRNERSASKISRTAKSFGAGGTNG